METSLTCVKRGLHSQCNRLEDLMFRNTVGRASRGMLEELKEVIVGCGGCISEAQR